MYFFQNKDTIMRTMKVLRFTSYMNQGKLLVAIWVNFASETLIILTKLPKIAIILFEVQLLEPQV